MSVNVDPNLMKDLKAFGLKDAKKCYHCGNCTAVCPLSDNEHIFPRKFVKYAQLGLKDRILQSPDPWLCYYCGECSTNCPRGAEPGETMMVMRRYLTSLYDWTGFSRKFYTSEKFEIISIIIVALLTGLGFTLFHGPLITDRVAINSLWPAPNVELFDFAMAGVLTFFLLSNVFRCYKFIMGDLSFKVPIAYFINEVKELIVHVLTQKRFNTCENNKTLWVTHLITMTAYSTIFFLVVVLLRWFQRDEILPFFHPLRILGYYATIGILYGTTFAIIGRLRKSRPMYKYSHPTDWMFLILLNLTALTGILIHFGRLLELPMPTYIIYVVHMMVLIPMLVLEVPFSKWSHLAYRPFVIFILKVKESYLKEQETVKATT